MTWALGLAHLGLAMEPFASLGLYLPTCKLTDCSFPVIKFWIFFPTSNDSRYLNDYWVPGAKLSTHFINLILTALRGSYYYSSTLQMRKWGLREAGGFPEITQLVMDRDGIYAPIALCKNLLTASALTALPSSHTTCHWATPLGTFSKSASTSINF